MWEGRSFRLPPDDDPQKRLQRGGCHAHGRGTRNVPNRIRDGAVLGRVRRVLPQPCGATHPHIDHHRTGVSRDGTGECIRLGAAQTLEPVHRAAIRRSDMGTQALRRDALRVLVRLRLIVRPSHAGRERGDNASRDFHIPLRTNRREGFSERVSLAVPTLGGVEIVQRGVAQQADERLGGAGADGFVTLGAGGAHACIVPWRRLNVNP